MSGYPSKRAHHSGKRMMLVRGIVVLPAPVPELTRELGSRSRCSADHATCLCSLPSRGRCVRGAALFSGSAHRLARVQDRSNAAHGCVVAEAPSPKEACH